MHTKKMCLHDDVVSQCRCMGPFDIEYVDCTSICVVRHGEMLTVCQVPYVGKHRIKDR